MITDADNTKPNKVFSIKEELVELRLELGEINDTANRIEVKLNTMARVLGVLQTEWYGFGRLPRG